ncbi:hypothetical protein H5T51_06765 [Candidatus Bathyarchaeota archaeon]|nr:hypothetical protein [Candidatus Bathyarchaeota archaeon]
MNSQRKNSRLFTFLSLPSVLFAAYYILLGKLLEAAVITFLWIGIVLALRFFKSKGVPSKLDAILTTVIFHMYCMSMGQTSPEDLVKTISESEEYGLYSRIFRKIRRLAKDFGYGITKATANVAETLKPPLKDILTRLINVFASVEPKGYLEMESSMLIEEYSGYYTRTVETIKNLGGIFTSFQSVTVFLIMTIVIMAIFMIDPSAIVFGYIISAISLTMMYILFRTSSPKENIIYIGKYPPRTYLLMKWSLIITGTASTVFAMVLYISRGAAIAFITLGFGFVIPGIFGYMLERQTAKIDRDYPTFLKALGENMASTLNLKAALYYISQMELGSPLKPLVKRAWERLKIGIGHEQTFESLAAESASYQVHIGNRIFLDAVSRGANPLEVGNALGNRVVKFIEFRKARDVVAKGFQTIVMVMQPLTVTLLVAMRVLAEFMSQYLVTLPYFGFNTIPIPIVEAGNIALVFIMAFVNALTIKEISAGYWGSFFLNLGILLMISGATWIIAQTFIESMMGSMPSFELPV